MKRSSANPYLPVIIIALGAVAIVVGAVMIALRERQRQRRGISDDPLEDTAEVDATPGEIAAANGDVDEAGGQGVRTIPPVDEAPDAPPADAVGARIEATSDGLLVHVPDADPDGASVRFS